MALFETANDTPELRSHAIQNMTGTSGRQRVPAECLNSFPVVVPSAPVAARYGEWCQPIMAMMKARDEESRTLAATRDALLPKLLSGEVRVGEAA
jgi:type I restriction enzyme S subunit